MAFGIIENGIVVKRLESDPHTIFVPEYASRFVAIPDYVQEGSAQNQDGTFGPDTRVPATISPRQIRQALTAAGLRAAVESAVAAGSQDLKDWWEFATQFERQHPLVIAMAAQLGASDAAIDDLWRVGASI